MLCVFYSLLIFLIFPCKSCHLCKGLFYVLSLAFGKGSAGKKAAPEAFHVGAAGKLEKADFLKIVCDVCNGFIQAFQSEGGKACICFAAVFELLAEKVIADNLNGMREIEGTEFL